MNYEFVFIGAIVTLSGVLMKSIKPNFFIGIRIPATLNNEDVWKKTHVLASKLFIASGLLIVTLSQLLSLSLITIVAPALVGSAIVISIAYSIHISKRT